MGNTNKQYGYLRLWRSFFRHPLWLEKRVFSQAEAMLDLLAGAAYAAGEDTVCGRVVRIGRGDLLRIDGEYISLRMLGERWGWGKNRVDSFLQRLCKEKTISLRTVEGTRQTVITLLNFELYNPPYEASFGHGFDENNGRTDDGTLFGTAMYCEAGYYKGGGNLTGQDAGHHRDTLQDTPRTKNGTGDGTPSYHVMCCKAGTYEDVAENTGQEAGHRRDTFQDSEQDIIYKESSKERLEEYKHTQYFSSSDNNARAPAREATPGEELMKWVAAWLPGLLEMKRPLTLHQCEGIMRRLDREDAERILIQVCNKGGLKNESAIATIACFEGLDIPLKEKRARRRQQGAAQLAADQHLKAQLDNNRTYNYQDRALIVQGLKKRLPETAEELKQMKR